jgi:hypothetical protein
MGTWGTGIFSDDIACDVRDHYRELLEGGAEDDEATRLTVEKYRAYLDEPDGVALLALAVTQSRLGRLDTAIRDQALAALDRGGDLNVWAEENPKQLPRRRAALDKAHAQLTGPQPSRRRVRPPKRELAHLTAGDVLALTLARRLALLRVVRVRQHRLGESPVLEELDYEGAEVPPHETLNRLDPKTEDTIAWADFISGDTRLHAFVSSDRIDWEAAGFRKAGSISIRPGDQEAPLPGYGVSWSTLAANYRERYGSQ